MSLANGSPSNGANGSTNGSTNSSVQHGRPAAPEGAVTTGRPARGPLTPVTGVLVAAGMLALLIGASHLPVTFNPSDQALLRVAWSARPERVESCRTLSEAELEALPQHMRQRVVCEGTTSQYRLDILRDGQPLSSAVLRGGGLRHDRQLYAFQELPIPHGSSTLQVTLTRLGVAPEGEVEPPGPGGAVPAMAAAPTTDRDRRELDEHRRRVEDEVPASLTLSETVTLAPREVALLTYDPGARRFRLVRQPQDMR